MKKMAITRNNTLLLVGEIDFLVCRKTGLVEYAKCINLEATKSTIRPPDVMEICTLFVWRISAKYSVQFIKEDIDHRD